VILKVNGKEIKWEDAPKGYFAVSGVKQHVLWRDEKTGANLTLLKGPKGKGWDSPHTHPNANEWTIILAGEGEAADGTRTTASADDIMFDFSPKGKTHGTAGEKIIQEVIWLRYQDGPSTRVNK
jgi:hypothetical protein